MTIEEKAKAYDEALEAAQEELKQDLHESGVWAIKRIFPELRESEDERMMREFNDWLCEEIECRTNDLRDEKDRRTLNMLCYILTKVKDWLEKQKEPDYPKRNVLFDKCVENCDPEVMKAIEDVIRVYGKTQGEWIAGYDMDTLVVHLRKAFAALEKQKESKIEWTKEDEQDLNHIRCVLDDCYAYGKHDLSKVDRDNLMQFLRSLRPFDKLTEEKSTIIKTIMSILSDAEFNGYISIDTLKVCNDFLKSLYS